VVEVVAKVLRAVYYDLSWLACFDECYVRRPWVYVGKVGFYSLITWLPLLLGASSPCR
jgi:hypothetical protein